MIEQTNDLRKLNAIYLRVVSCIGTLDGAGGVGGLLATEVGGVWYFPLYDNNGNVTDYVSETGEVVASYEYDAFGRAIAQSGAMADMFPFRFSTKYYDAESGLYYYGYRYYSPELGRWLTRDPIEEDGGDNLYAFCGNNALAETDSLGLSPKLVGDYMVEINQENVTDTEFDNLEKIYFRDAPGAIDSLTGGFTKGVEIKGGRWMSALDHPAYQWKEVKSPSCANKCWQLQKTGIGSYTIVIRIRESCEGVKYPSRQKPDTKVTIQAHEEAHAAHIKKYIWKMSKCYEKLSTHIVNDYGKRGLTQYLKNMDAYYFQFALGKSAEMDFWHYGNHTGTKEEVETRAKTILEVFTVTGSNLYLDFAKDNLVDFGISGATCDAWENYEKDLPIP